LQCVAVCCSMLQHVAACCSVLQCVAVCCDCERNLAHVVAGIFLQKSSVSLHNSLHKRAPHLFTNVPYFFPQKSPVCLHKRAIKFGDTWEGQVQIWQLTSRLLHGGAVQKSPASLYKRAPYFRKRAPYLRTRAINLGTRAINIYYTWEGPVQIWQLTSRLVHGGAAQKSPVFLHKRAPYLRKRGLYFDKRALCSDVSWGAGAKVATKFTPTPWRRSVQDVIDAGAFVCVCCSVVLCGAVWCCVVLCVQVFPACKMLSMVVPFCVFVCVLQCV